MPSQQLETCYTYREGFDPRLLPVGSLFLDYRNLTVKLPCRYPELSEDEQKKWAISDVRTNCYLHFENQTEHIFGAGIEKLAELDFAKADSTSTFIAAAQGSKLFIPEAQDFFNEVTMNTARAQTWVTTRVSVGRGMKYLKGVRRQVPIIWMLTGVYFLDDAISWSTHGNQNQKGAEVNMPIPDPTSFAELLQAKGKARYATKSGRVFEHGMQIADRKVCAASFQRLDVEYMHFKQGMKVLPSRISLLDVFSTARGPEDENTAQIKVSNEFDTTVDFGRENIDSAFDDQYWTTFLSKVGKIEAQAEKAREKVAKSSQRDDSDQHG